MSNEEKIQYYRSKTIEELEELANDINLLESDIVIVSVELGRKQYNLGMYYTTEEVLEHIFGKNSVVENS